MWFTDDDSPFASLLDGVSQRAGFNPAAMDPGARQGLRRDTIGAFFQNMRELGAGRSSSLSGQMSALADDRMQRKLRELQMMQAQQKVGVQQHLADIFQQGAQPAGPAAADGPQASGAGRNPRQLWADMYRQAGDYMASVGMTEDAKRYWERSLQLDPTPKFSTDPKVVQTDDGLRFMVLDENTGQPKLLDGVLPPQEIAREVVVQGPNGPQKLLLDDQGNEVKRFDEFVAPVAVNAGDRQVFVRPEAGAEVPVNLSPSERANLARRDQEIAISRGNQGLARQRLTLEQQRARQEQRAAAATTAPDGTKLPSGFRWNAEKGEAEPIPGTKEAVERKQEAATLDTRDQHAFAQAEVVLDKVDEALANVGVTTAGFGGALAAKIPGSPARDLRADLETIKANLGFDQLQAMRAASPTGGALGQVAVQELNALQSTIASLDAEQSPPALKKGLKQVQHHYNRWKYVMNKARQTRGLPPIKSKPKGREASGKVVDFGSLK